MENCHRRICCRGSSRDPRTGIGPTFRHDETERTEDIPWVALLRRVSQRTGRLQFKLVFWFLRFAAAQVGHRDGTIFKKADTRIIQ